MTNAAVAIQTSPSPAGVPGTLKALRLMARFVRRDAGNQQVRALALQIVGDAPGHDFNEEIKRIFAFCRDAITYRRDPVWVERVQDAQRTVQFGAGDCDDKTVLLCSLLAALGHVTRFCVTGPNPQRWSHVYCEVRTREGRWLPLDPTPETAQPGWETDAPCKGVFEVWPQTSKTIRVVRGAVPAASNEQRSAAAWLNDPEFQAWLAGDLACPECGTFDWEVDALAEEKQKKCGFFCKLGRGVKKVGKVALKVAPLALAPFTGGASAIIGGAAGAAASTAASWGAKAASWGSQAAQAANTIINSGAQQSAASSAESQPSPSPTEIAAMQAQAQAQAAIQAQGAARAEANERGGSATASLTASPLFWPLVIVGGIALLGNKQ